MHFTDTSSGARINSWTWNFGDGSPNSVYYVQTNPTHTYHSGTFTVFLTVDNGYMTNSSVKSNYIQVDSPESSSKIGVFRNSTGYWYLDSSGNGAWGTGDTTYVFGVSGDVPVTGDWNAEGKTEIGVFRPSTHMFYLDYNGDGAWNGAVIDRQYNFGLTGDNPVSGKWA